MVREMERAAAKLMRPLLAPGQLSVGVRVEVGHLAPTPVGGRVVTRARLAGREGRLYWFEVRAEDAGGVIGEGRHARAIVEEARLLAAAARRFGIPTLHDLAADDITAVFAAAGAVFSTSMHAAIVSASFGSASRGALALGSVVTVK